MGSKIRKETEITGWLPGPTPDNGFWGLTIESCRRAATRRSIRVETKMLEVDRLGFEIHLPSIRPEHVT